MKQHRFSLYITAAALMLALASCHKDDPKPPTPEPTPGEGDALLSITTAAIETKAAMLQFGANDKMNIFPCTYNRVDAPNMVDGVVASYDGTKWTLSPAVPIAKDQIAYVFAVAPYDATYTSPKNVPVDIAKQVDLLYSGSYVPASNNTPTVRLNMKHALMLTTFNIAPVNYSGAGNLESLSLSGDIVYTKGTMDVSNGKITPTGNSPVVVPFKKTISKGGWNADMPGLWNIAFNSQDAPVTLTAVIDGKTYKATLPELEMKAGYQYIFRLVLTDSGLEFDPSQTETISLNVTQDQPLDFNGYGLITLTASGSSLLAPIMLGDAIFGTVSSPAGNLSYTSRLTVSGLKAGDKVKVETWNSTGFTIESLEGIDEIDLTQY